MYVYRVSRVKYYKLLAKMFLQKKLPHTLNIGYTKPEFVKDQFLSSIIAYFQYFLDIKN